MMKRTALSFVLLALVVVPAAAQNIATETSDRSRVVHLKTALNHLTVIEVSEPVIQVAAGSPSFKVEWRENKVFVQPTEIGEASNLFIWTASQRLNYELEPAGPVASMDFAIDQAPVHHEPVKPASVAPPPQPSVTELLLAGKPVRMLSSKQRNTKPVEVTIRDLYERDGRLLIRYAVLNHSSESYTVETPAVFELSGVRTAQSLYGISNAQLGDAQAAKLRARQQTPVKVLEGQFQATRVAPGEEAFGVIALELAPHAEPTVLRLQFSDLKAAEGESNASSRQIAAYLVH